MVVPNNSERGSQQQHQKYYRQNHTPNSLLARHSQINLT
jgi:hypothetical protein